MCRALVLKPRKVRGPDDLSLRDLDDERMADDPVRMSEGRMRRAMLGMPRRRRGLGIA
jgi:hypothetical protein